MAMAQSNAREAESVTVSDSDVNFSLAFLHFARVRRRWSSCSQQFDEAMSFWAGLRDSAAQLKQLTSQVAEVVTAADDEVVPDESPKISTGHDAHAQVPSASFLPHMGIGSSLGDTESLWGRFSQLGRALGESGDVGGAAWRADDGSDTWGGTAISNAASNDASSTMHEPLRPEVREASGDTDDFGDGLAPVSLQDLTTETTAVDQTRAVRSPVRSQQRAGNLSTDTKDTFDAAEVAQSTLARLARDQALDAAQLRARLAEEESARGELEGRITTLQVELARARDALATSQRTSASIDDSHAAYERLLAAYTRVQADAREAMEREDASAATAARERALRINAEELATALRAACDAALADADAARAEATAAHSAAAAATAAAAVSDRRIEALEAARRAAEASAAAAHHRAAELEHDLDVAGAAATEASDGWSRREASLSGALAQAEARAARSVAAEGELARLRTDLELRDADLIAAREAISNLNTALAALTSGRAGNGADSSATAARLESAEMENASLRTALQEALEAVAAANAADANGAAAATAAAAAASSARLEAMQLRCATLAASVHELRAALDDARARTMDAGASLVDRRVVAALLFTFLSESRRAGAWSGLGGSRARDALHVLASLLGWDEAHRAEAGVDDVAAAPTAVAGRVGVSIASGALGLLASLIGNADHDAAAKHSGDAPATSASAIPPLGLAFAQFLMAETSGALDGAIADGGAVLPAVTVAVPEHCAQHSSTPTASLQVVPTAPPPPPVDATPTHTAQL